MKVFISFLLIISIIVFNPEKAFACECYHPEINTDEKLRNVVTAALDGAEAVFSGEVVGMNESIVEFRLEMLWKGDFKDKSATITRAVLSDKGSYISTPCRYDFEVGAKYLVFADQTSDGMIVTVCSRTTPLSDAKRLVSELNRIKMLFSTSPSYFHN